MCENVTGFGLIPPEIMETLERKDLGYTWLIKGKAGAGKTTFSLTLMKTLKDYEPIYLSTRVSPSSLYNQFPWLKDQLKQANILDATRTFIPPVNHPEQMKPHLMRTLQFSTVPEFLKIIYEKATEFERVLIVIDSWDAIARSGMDSKENIETLLTEFVRQTNAKLILISENDEPSFLDYIVDGILTIEDGLVDGRVLRYLHINKIRTVERRQKTYPFTLENNQFNYCAPFKEVKPKKILPWKETEDNDDLYSTGNKCLDELYGGGLRQGTFNLLEVESTVSIQSYSTIMIGLICNFIKHQRGVIIHTMEGINSDLIDKKRLFLYLQTDLISRNLRIIMEQISDRKEIRPYIVQVEDDDFKDTFFKVYADLSCLTKFQPVFAGISYDTLQFLVDFDNAISQFYKHLKLIRNSNVIELGIINSNHANDQGGATRQLGSFTQDLSYVADTHFKIIEREGSHFIYGIKPRTILYHIEKDFSKGYPQIRLTPIV